MCVLLDSLLAAGPIALHNRNRHCRRNCVTITKMLDFADRTGCGILISVWP